MDTFSTLRDLSPLALFVVFVLATLKFMSDQSARETARSQADADRRTASYDRLADTMNTLEDAVVAQTANTRQNTIFTHKASKTIEKTAQEVQALSGQVIQMGTTIPKVILDNQAEIAKKVIEVAAPIPQRLSTIETKIDESMSALGDMKFLVESHENRISRNDEAFNNLLAVLDDTIKHLEASNTMLAKMVENGNGK